MWWKKDWLLLLLLLLARGLLEVVLVTESFRFAEEEDVVEVGGEEGDEGESRMAEFDMCGMSRNYEMVTTRGL